MIDLVKLNLLAGDGGDGRVSLHREKYRPKGGPDGGAGGNGGHIILQGDPNINTLKHYAGVKDFTAENGRPGGKNNKHGQQGTDVVLKVPLGTVVWLAAENDASGKRRKKYEVPSVEFDLEEGADEEQEVDEDQAAGEDQLAAEDSQESDQLNPFRLHINRNRDEVEFEKYFLQEEGQRPPAKEQDQVLPVDPAREAVPAKDFSKDIFPDEPNQQARDQDKALESSQTAIKLVEIRHKDQQVVLCQGGFGGRGNSSFKSSTNRTPLEAEYGTPGEKKTIILELRLLADVGLVGFPNAGKSTLLSRLTEAHPKIGNYPFTTLEPQLGVMTSDDGQKELIVADIPGLIEGASQGKGLGDKFLRHIQNCQALLYVLFLKEGDVFNEELSLEDKAELVWEQYQQLKEELEDHHPELLDKDSLVSLNKIDLYSDDLLLAIEDFFAKRHEEVVFFSGITGDGLSQLKQALFK